VRSDFYFFQIFTSETLSSLKMRTVSLIKPLGKGQSFKFYERTKYVNFDFEAVGGNAKEHFSDTCSSKPLTSTGSLRCGCPSHPHLQFIRPLNSCISSYLPFRHHGDVITKRVKSAKRITSVNAEMRVIL